MADIGGGYSRIQDIYYIHYYIIPKYRKGRYLNLIIYNSYWIAIKYIFFLYITKAVETGYLLKSQILEIYNHIERQQTKIKKSSLK